MLLLQALLLIIKLLLFKSSHIYITDMHTTLHIEEEIPEEMSMMSILNRDH